MKKLLWRQAMRRLSGFAIIVMGGACLLTAALPALAESNPGPISFVQRDSTLHGRVTDSLGTALPGVTIKVKGTSNGTATNANGYYQLAAPKNAVLEISYIGFQPQVVNVGSRSMIDIIMQSSATQIGETVVVAFGRQKKTEVVGAVTSINPAEMKIPSSNLTQALAGRLAGVIAYQRSGEPGQDNAEFFIRGVTTFGYKQDPLILIDGMELTTTDLARMNVDDIATFTIMKDATATSLYGARGANGVILVTTKEGKEGAARINIRLESSLSKPTRDLEMADNVTYMRLHNEAITTRNPLAITPYTQYKIDQTAAGANPVAFPSNNWQSVLLKKQTINKRGNFNVSGGGKVAMYNISGSYSHDNGLFKVDKRNNFNSGIDLKSYGLRANLNVNITPTTKAGFRFYGSFDDYNGPIQGGEYMYRLIMRSNPVLFPAYFPKDEEHEHVRHIMFGNAENGAYINPYAEMVKGYKDYSRALMLAQFEVNQDLKAITEGLRFRGMMNTNRESFFDIARNYIPFYYQMGFYDKRTDTYRYDQIEQGEEFLSNGVGKRDVTTNFYLESALDYRRVFNKYHTLSGMLVYMMRNKLEATEGDIQSSLPFRNSGLSGRLTYGYDDRYFVEFNFGYNGSERFYKTERFGFFPSAGMGWTVSNEPFWKPFKRVVNNLKLRGTYGLVGNDAIGRKQDRFFYLSNINMKNSAKGASFGFENALTQQGISISRYDNRFITWETSDKTNLGLELGLFEAINIQADFWHDYRHNILMARTTIPASMGLQATTYANMGKASSQGLDFSIDGNKHFSQNFWVGLRGNFTLSANKYRKFEEPEYNEKYLSKIGYSTNQVWGFIAERLFVDEHDVANSPRQTFSTDYMAGDIKYRDVNGDGEITDLDKVPIGNPQKPEIVYGFGVTAGYKGFDFSMFFQGMAQESFWINPGAVSPFGAYNYSGEAALPGRPVNQLMKAIADDHWSEDNRNIYALWPRLSEQMSANNAQTSTWWMRDGSFLRLKSIEIGYTLPKPLQRRYSMTNFRIYMNGTNLLTWSKFKLWDVEMAGEGLDYPIQKVFNLGLMVSF